jgi:D-3-phosphoglycerate dehydrogenase
VIIKILEPIGFENNLWIEDLRKEFSAAFEEIDAKKLSDSSLIPLIKDADALVLTNRPLSQKLLAACPKLQFLAVAFTGIDHIDTEEITKRGIIIKNAAGYATHAVAELTIGLALELYRNIHKACSTLTEQGLFPLGKELFGKKVGIIGEGAIGKETSRLFSAFGCEVLIYKKGSCCLEELLKTSDIISLHIPLNTETVNFIDAQKLSLMKPSAILINTARGPIVNEQALTEAILKNKIAGAALDVFDIEPPLTKDHPLLNLNNVLLTPHIGYRTKEAARKKAEITINNLKNWLRNSL